MTERDGSERAPEDADDDAPPEDGDDDAQDEAESAAAESAESPEKKTKKKKRKKKRKDRDAGDEPETSAEAADPKKKKKNEKKAAPLPGPGTPDGERLRAAHRAFDAGDYRQVRELCRALESSDVPGVPAAAKELYIRTTVDPAQVVVMLACAGVLAAIIWVWVV